MNKLFKFLVFILFLEIFLGYIVYIRNSTYLTGHYISATIKGINKAIDIIEFQSIKKIENNKEIDKEDNQTNEETNFKKNIDKCSKYLNKNQHIILSNIETLGPKLNMQSDIEFLNSFNESDHYLVVLFGNSETFGRYQDFENRLHITLQKKLRKKFQSKKIFVVNHSYPGAMMSDHVIDMLTFSKFYKPDLAIFYSGGNELILTDKYERIVKDSVIDKNKFLKLDFYENELLLPNNIRYCLNQEKYLTKENFKIDDLSIDIERYIKTNFKRIKENSIDNSIEFIFYIQPFSPIAPEPNNPSFVNYYNSLPNYTKMKSIDIQESEFKNLNLININKELIFIDLFHTRDAEKISEILLEDITKDYETKILKKIN